MRWGALCLLILNIALWVGAGAMHGHLLPREAAHGRLPRVAPLEIVGHDKPGASRQNQSVSGEPALDEQVGAAVTDSEGRTCVVVGWFESKAAAQRAAMQVDVIPDEFAVRAESRPAQPYHWVILPPSPSREAALSRLAEIQQRGIDSYLVTEGPHVNAISLGLFESLEAAEAVLSRSQAKGLEATLATFPRNHIRYALVFPAQFRDGKEPLVQSRQELETRFGSVTFGRCEGVATLQKNP